MSVERGFGAVVKVLLYPNKLYVELSIDGQMSETDLYLNYPI